MQNNVFDQSSGGREIVSSIVPPKNNFNWLDAWRAVQALMENKEDTAQVFSIMKALRGNSIERGFQKFRQTERGYKILLDNENLLDILKDRHWLSRLPEESFGRAYLNFMIREKITAEGLAEASADAGYTMAHKGVVLYGCRLRDQHDLWHVLTGYGRDGVGEACMTAFSYAQTKNLGFAAIAIMAGWTFSRAFPGDCVPRAVLQAYSNGRKAGWLPGQDWRYLLTLPLDKVRQDLNINPPTYYRLCKKAVQETGIDYTPKSA